jgi:acylphosphatase
MQEKVKAHLIISGKVQGVWFRAETQKAAVQFGVSGWVRNKKDGTVEAVAEGDKRDVTSLINWCQKGPPLARVVKVDVQWNEYQGKFEHFDVLYSHTM